MENVEKDQLQWAALRSYYKINAFGVVGNFLLQLIVEKLKNGNNSDSKTQQNNI